MFKAIIFDIGQTLVEYNKPLNWSESYRPALERSASICGINITEQGFEKAIEVLTKYNTRINPREYEVSSVRIFGEIFNALALPDKSLLQFKEEFYRYFCNDTSVYSDVKPALEVLCAKGFKIGALSDVAYGMDNEFALADISEIKDYIQFPFTSNDVGYRKPSTKGPELLSQKMDVKLSDMIMVGDEEKDIICANSAGVYSVLINRSTENKDYGQRKTIHSMLELTEILTEDRI